MTRDRVARVLLVLVPVAVQAALIVREILEWLPVWAWYPDPGYHYLLSGVVITTGSTPQHTDHPGTSLQWLIGGTERLTHALLGNGEFATDVVSRPEFYSQAVAIVLAVLYIGALSLAALRMLRYLGVWGSLVFQCLLVWGLPVLAVGRYRVMPESLVLTCAVIALALLAPALIGRMRDVSLRVAISLGLVTAVGITAKVLFLPIIVVVLLVLPWRRVVPFLVGLIVSASVLLLAILPRLGTTAAWFIGLATNPGRQGQVGGAWRPLGQFLDSMLMISSFVRWFIPVAGLILIGTLITMIVGRGRIGRSAWRGIVAALVGLTLALAAGIKPAEPRDFLLAIPLLAVTAAIGMYWVGILTTARVRVVVLGSALLVATFLAAHGLVGSVYFGNANAATVRAIEKAAPDVDQFVGDGTWGLGYNVRTERGSLLQTIPWMVGDVTSALDSHTGGNMYFDLWARGFVSPRNPQETLTCPDLAALVDARPVGLIVESRNHLTFDESGMRILLDGAQVSFRGPESVGPYFAYQLTDVTCDSPA